MNPAQQAEKTKAFLLELDLIPEFVEKCHGRTVGADGSKYHDPQTDTMLFETMPLPELFRYTEEEILDVPNYAWMLLERGVDRKTCEMLVTLAEGLYRVLYWGRRPLP